MELVYLASETKQKVENNHRQAWDWCTLLKKRTRARIEIMYLASETKQKVENNGIGVPCFRIRTEGWKEPALEWNWCSLLVASETEQKVGKTQRQIRDCRTLLQRTEQKVGKNRARMEPVYLASENRTEGIKEPELEGNRCTLLQT
jgi:hypothetical protein